MYHWLSQLLTDFINYITCFIVVCCINYYIPGFKYPFGIVGSKGHIIYFYPGKVGFLFKDILRNNRFELPDIHMAIQDLPVNIGFIHLVELHNSN